MGPDASVLFRQWGHAALCVGDRCLNYGVTDFSRPLALIREVIEARAIFWVEVSRRDALVAAYIAQGRSVFRQDLVLPPEGRAALLARVAADVVPGQSEYVYNHFDENCTTRVRDYLDAAAGGALRRPVALPPEYAGRGGEATLRTHIRRGLGGRPFLLWLSDVGAGSAVDRPIRSFEAMFLPGALRVGVEAALGAAPVRLHTGRDGDLLPPDPGSAPALPWLFGISLGLAGLILSRRGSRAATVGAAALLTLLGAVALFVRLWSPLPEFGTSLAFLVFLPSDFLLATRAGRWYAPGRLAAGAAALALLPFVTPQPLGWTALAVLLPVAAIVWRRWRP